MRKATITTPARYPPLDHLPSSPDSRLHVPELDGLRGIAISLILLVHFSPISVGPGDGRLVKLVSGVFGAGWVGVDLFFVLSGFLITGILIRSRSSPHRLRNFYCRRMLRIFPLYYAVLLLYFWFAPLARLIFHRPTEIVGTPQLWYRTYLSNWAMLLKTNQVQKGLGHFWSLAVEEQFYLFWPFVVFYLDPRLLYRAVGAAFIVSLIGKMWCISHHLDGYVAYSLSVCRIETLAMGAGLAAFLSAGSRRVQTKLFLALAVASISVCLAVAVFCHIFAGWDPTTQLVGFPALALLFASAIGLSTCTSHDGGYRRMLRHPTLVWLARYSYGIYVFHQLLRDCVLPSADWWNHITASRIFGGAAFFLTGVACSLTVAFISWHCYEKWFVGLKRRFTR